MLLGAGFPFKFCLPLNPISSCREIEIASNNQGPERPYWLTDPQESTSLVEDVEDFLPFKFCQKPSSGCREENCFSKSEPMATILDDGSALETQNWQRTLKTCFIHKFCRNLFGSCRDEIEQEYHNRDIIRPSSPILKD